jgi:flagellar protein FliO/FliZ
VKRLIHRAALYLLALLFMLTTTASAAQFAAPDAPAAASTASSALRVPLALLLVIALVLCAAWFMRRMLGGSALQAQRIQVLAQLSLGTRDRALLVRVGGQDLLLGVGAGGVRTLHAFSAPVEMPGAAASASAAAGESGSSFREILRRSLGK